MRDPEAFQLRAIFGGVRRFQGYSYPCLVYTVRAKRPDGQVRVISASVEIRNPEDVTRLQTEFREGEEIEITLKTDESSPDLPTTLIAFAPVNPSLTPLN